MAIWVRWNANPDRLLPSLNMLCDATRRPLDGDRRTENAPGVTVMR